MAGFTKSLGLIGHMWRRQYSQCATSSLRFQSAGNNLVGLLTVGAVIGTGVTITDYVIEWRLGSVTGEIVLITGIGPDPAIQAFHPLVSEPVVGGVLYAVIRYIVIDGIRYSPYFMEGQSSPDLLTCLGSVTITTMNCSNGYMGGYYPHTVSYINTAQPASNAERTLRFDLNPDGSTTEFAWSFWGYTIADRVQIYYVSEGVETKLKDWVIGTSNNGNDFTSVPKRCDAQRYQGLIDLTAITYLSGDYLLIKVSPSYDDPSIVDTNWKLELKCFNTATPFNRVFASPDTNLFDPASIEMTWNGSLCQYELHFNTGTDEGQRYLSDYYNYLGILGYNSWDWSVGQMVLLPKKLICPINWGVNSGGWVALAGTLTIFKVGTVLTYQFDNAGDYNFFKSDYATSVTNARWVDYSADNTNILHYKWWYFYEKISLTGGDTVTNRAFTIGHDSQFAFDDTNHKIVIALEADTNEYVSGATCDEVHQTLDGWISLVNQLRAEPDFSYTTIFRAVHPASNTYASVWNYNISTNQSNIFAAILEGYFDNAFPLAPDWFVHPGFGWVFNKTYLRVDITDVNDPIHHYKVYSKLRADGSEDTSWTLIKTVP